MYEALTDNSKPTNVRMSQRILHFPLHIPSEISYSEGSNLKYVFGHAPLMLKINFFKTTRLRAQDKLHTVHTVPYAPRN